VTWAQRSVAYAQQKIARVKCDVVKGQLKVDCLKRVWEKGANLTIDEYAGLLATTDELTADLIKWATTIKIFTVQEAEQKLKEAEQELKEAEQELKEAEQELNEAKQAAGSGTPFILDMDPSLSLKKRIPYGQGIELLGKLFGREKGLNQIKEGYAILARKRGNVSTDKKAIPIIVCAAQPGTGKTEILKYVHNHHGHFSDGTGNQQADEVMKLINDNSPAGTKPLVKIITLFCTFSQNSKFEIAEESVILQTTTERLIRSYEGRFDFALSDTDNFTESLGTLLEQIPLEVGKSP
jgi:hypothetical protein